MLAALASLPSPDQPATGHGRHRRPPSRGLRIGVALALVAGVLGVAGFRYLSFCGGAEGPREPLPFEVAVGESAGDVVTALHDLGVVRCETFTGWELRRQGIEGSIRAGSYTLTTNMRPREAFAILTSPPPEVPTTRLTIPEGYRLTQIAERVQETLGIPARRFLRALDAGGWSLPPYLPADAVSPEGFLFPDTYEFRSDGTTADDVIRLLLETFGQRVADLPWSNAEALGLSPYEIVIVASMIEEEARIDGDRAKIAAVIYNRLRIGMTLGIDATLQYDDPTPGDGLTSADFATDGPYNTRLRYGLPPTPIASPGLASLRAALEPADVTFLYYVLCGDDGAHAFSNTFERFTADVARCLG